MDEIVIPDSLKVAPATPLASPDKPIEAKVIDPADKLRKADLPAINTTDPHGVILEGNMKHNKDVAKTNKDKVVHSLNAEYRIKTILAAHGMDSQQAGKAMIEIKSILNW